METTQLRERKSDVGTPNNLDYSKGEFLIKNITIPNSQFCAKWTKEEGYSVGIENVKLTENFKTLEEALNQIGYGVEEDESRDQILVKVGDLDYEMIVRIVKALLIIEEMKGENNNG